MIDSYWMCLPVRRRSPSSGSWKPEGSTRRVVPLQTGSGRGFRLWDRLVIGPVAGAQPISSRSGLRRAQGPARQHRADQFPDRRTSDVRTARPASAQHAQCRGPRGGRTHRRGNRRNDRHATAARWRGRPGRSLSSAGVALRSRSRLSSRDPLPQHEGSRGSKASVRAEHPVHAVHKPGESRSGPADSDRHHMCPLDSPSQAWAQTMQCP